MTGDDLHIPPIKIADDLGMAHLGLAHKMDFVTNITGAQLVIRSALPRPTLRIRMGKLVRSRTKIGKGR
jgi:hypothetical protein